MSLCSDNGVLCSASWTQPLLWIVVAPHFILTFSSLCSLISSPSPLLSCESEISYLKDKRWKWSKFYFIFSEQGFREEVPPAWHPREVNTFQCSRKGQVSLCSLSGKAFRRDDVAERQQILSWIPCVPPGDVPGLGEPVPGHTTRGFRVEQEEGAASAALRSGCCNHRGKFKKRSKNLFKRHSETRWVSTFCSPVLGVPTTNFQTPSNPNTGLQWLLEQLLPCAPVPTLPWATRAQREPGPLQDFHPNRGKQRNGERLAPNTNLAEMHQLLQQIWDWCTNSHTRTEVSFTNLLICFPPQKLPEMWRCVRRTMKGGNSSPWVSSDITHSSPPGEEKMSGVLSKKPQYTPPLQKTQSNTKITPANPRFASAHHKPRCQSGTRAWKSRTGSPNPGENSFVSQQVRI